MASTVLVVANPFVYLDHEGIPAGTYPFDPEHGAGSRRWVGAKIDLSLAADGKPKTRAVERRSRGDFSMTRKDRSGRAVSRVDIKPTQGQRTYFVFDLSPQPVLLTKHYRHGVKEGSLFPADATAAKKLGASTFTEPAILLRKAAQEAIAQWESNYGEKPDLDLWPENLRAIADDNGGGA